MGIQQFSDLSVDYASYVEYIEFMFKKPNLIFYCTAEFSSCNTDFEVYFQHKPKSIAGLGNCPGVVAKQGQDQGVS